eukprot:GHVU01103307.1.p3 GENE.GHVU01103307.1~~GHVU01103307.1.p3  ORF type:complete len:103 (+),score=9.39 GHVU01103307.1:251-559(+)
MQPEQTSQAQTQEGAMLNFRVPHGVRESRRPTFVEVGMTIFNSLIRCNRYLRDFQVVAEEQARGSTSTFVICTDPRGPARHDRYCVRPTGMQEVAVLQGFLD